MELKYLNSDPEKSLECFYEFPVDENTVIGQLIAKMGDEEIMTKIKGSEKAQEIYEDAMAGGRTAVMAQRSSKESLRVSLGNLPSQQTATLSFQLISKVPVELGSYCFRLPSDFCPNYKKLGAENEINYNFAIELDIKSTSPLAEISAPENSKITPS